MESSKVFLLVFGICFVFLPMKTLAECCTSSQIVSFSMERGNCADVGGYGGTICEVTICADGVARRGAYCGRGPCNLLGCNCEGGCLTGEWSDSFREKNKHYGVRIRDPRFPLV